MFPHTLQVSDQLRGRLVAQRAPAGPRREERIGRTLAGRSDGPWSGTVESGAVLACAQPSAGTAVPIQGQHTVAWSPLLPVDRRATRRPRASRQVGHDRAPLVHHTTAHRRVCPSSDPQPQCANRQRRWRQGNFMGRVPIGSIPHELSRSSGGCPTQCTAGSAPRRGRCSTPGSRTERRSSTLAGSTPHNGTSDQPRQRTRSHDASRAPTSARKTQLEATVPHRRAPMRPGSASDHRLSTAAGLHP